MLEHVVLLVSLLAMIYPVVRVILHLIRELRAKKLVVTDRDGNVLAEVAPGATATVCQLRSPEEILVSLLWLNLTAITFNRTL